MSVRESGSVEETTSASPSIPSFASLRDPQRRTPLDVLLPPSESPAAAREEPPVEVPPVRVPSPAVAAQRPPLAPRPAEWSDLLAFGVRLAGSAVRTATDLLSGARAVLRG